MKILYSVCINIVVFHNRDPLWPARVKYKLFIKRALWLPGSGTMFRRNWFKHLNTKRKLTFIGQQVIINHNFRWLNYTLVIKSKVSQKIGQIGVHIILSNQNQQMLNIFEDYFFSLHGLNINGLKFQFYTINNFDKLLYLWNHGLKSRKQFT